MSLAKAISRSLQVILSTQTVSRSEVASAALLSYDIFLTFGDEVEFVWLKQWSLAKAMYISARYIPWIIQMVLLTVNVDGTTGLLFKMEDCMKWVIVQAIFLQLTITIVDVILIARVYVLFQRNKPLIGTLISLLFIEIGYMTFVLAHVVSRLTFDDNCFVISSPSFFVSYWIVALFYQTLLYALTLYKFIQHIRSYKGGLRRSFLRCFIEDGTWAFTLIFGWHIHGSSLEKDLLLPPSVV
ncbi:hypothetical protein QCA50_019189 [Cerrena zonata]|uniref:DUF6533 domain-containing protein n=1 Tax=Cerrena zonata TaxID=2478898 RepID=A0AAW0FKV1_9APHY